MSNDTTTNGPLGDAFMFLLYEVQNKGAKITDNAKKFLNHLIVRVVDRARTPDEFEINADEIWPIGSEQQCILWYNLWWSVEDFLSLLIASDDLELAQRNQLYDADHRSFELRQEMERKPHDERFPLLLLQDTVLSSHRTEIKCFLLWFAISADTRIERLICKVSNVLVDELNLGVPKVSKILTMRRTLPAILRGHVRGYFSWQDTTEQLLAAYECGRTMVSSVEDAPAAPELRPVNSPDDFSLCDPDYSILGSLTEHTRFILRSSYPISFQSSSLLL